MTSPLSEPDSLQALECSDPFYAVQQALVYARTGVNMQAEIRSWFCEYIQASLRVNSGWKPHLTWNGSAIEPSINICGLPAPDSHLVEKTVRFGIEPISPGAGSSSDPFNQRAILELLEKLEACMPQLDLSLFRHFQSQFFVRETQDNVAKATKHGPPSSTCYIAFDLSAKGISAIGTKIYFVLSRASKIQGKNPAHVIRDAILQLDKAINSTFGVPYQTVLSYIAAPGAVFTVDDVEGLGIEPKALLANPRLKIYTHTHQYTFAAVEHALTLGGTVSNNSLSLLWELWQILFSNHLAEIPLEQQKSHAIKPDHNLHDRKPDFMFSFELKSGLTSPDIKFYLPLQYYNASDAVNAKKLSAFFLAQGWSDMACSYEDQLRKILPLNDIDHRGGSHTYMSFAMIQDRPYMTLYWQPDGVTLAGKESKFEGSESSQEEAEVVQKPSWLQRLMHLILCCESGKANT